MDQLRKDLKNGDPSAALKVAVARAGDDFMRSLRGSGEL